MFFKSNSLGLEIHQRGFSWAVASGSRDMPVIERYEISAAVDDLLRPSIKEPNVINPALLSKSLSEAYNKLATDTKRVSLSIPDQSGKILMLAMDSPISSKEEGVDQVKWKLKKSFPVDLNELHLDYHLLRVDEEGVSTLLVALAARSVVNEYEELLQSISLEPDKIDFATFNLYRLFSSRLEINEHLAFLVCLRGTLTVLIFQEGVLDFYRSKFIGSSITDPVRLYREVNSSLLVYSDSKGGLKPQRLFYNAVSADRQLLRSVIFEATGFEPVLIDTDALINSSKQKIDRSELPEILSAVGAASRSLG